MKNLVIEGSHGTFFTPAVNFNADSGVCELAGESFLEDTVDFYEVLNSWLHEFVKNVRKPLKFVIKLTYFNTSTSRALLDLLTIVKEYEESGGTIIVEWHYDENDSDMEEDIEDYVIDTGLKINMIPF